jgi:hypothetical protein
MMTVNHGLLLATAEMFTTTGLWQRLTFLDHLRSLLALGGLGTFAWLAAYT